MNRPVGSHKNAKEKNRKKSKINYEIINQKYRFMQNFDQSSRSVKRGEPTTTKKLNAGLPHKNAGVCVAAAISTQLSRERAWQNTDTRQEAGNPSRPTRTIAGNTNLIAVRSECLKCCGMTDRMNHCLTRAQKGVIRLAVAGRS